ncbi:glycoside hydrolase family 3 N-terminal domain-containing protein [uncultured Flavobacterium sp.]|uniref:glycoside hydrolase family 3 N-terminal domain-containing protein n=1 Tax=uncultured Flavobacterium sp. TaxID=165435 RepID=UPI0030EB4AEE|tara:strand:+ start:41287 stop:44214 length:2928 start_codon:yes stop_codon:yes gene_type:complete
MLKYNLVLLFILVSLFNYNRPIHFSEKEKIEVKDIYEEQRWVDSVYKKMSFDEKVGQLFMVAAYSNKDEAHYRSIDKLVTDYKVGGLIFFQGGPVRQAELTNRYQSKSKLPMLVGIDAEWGLSMRIDSTYKYPWNMTLGAIKDNSLIEKMGEQMAEQSKRLGINFTFSPVVDINTNPNNPIIGNRSFGETREIVTEKALAYMTGLQNNGVFATAKHFPGHGDTSSDSHHTLPTVAFSKERIDSIEVYPYKKLIEKGLASVMVAHLNVPSLESQPNLPSSLSSKVVTDILKNDLKFEGLIFTDALNMKGASNFKQPGDIDLAAFLAGNDVLLFSEDVPKALQKFKEAYKKKTLTEKRLAYSVKKILKYKFKAGLKNYKPITLENLYEDLNKPEFDALNEKLFENAITTLQNVGEIIPIASLKTEKIAYVKIGDDSNEVFIKSLNEYTKVEDITGSSIEVVLSKLQDYTKVIIGFHKVDNIWKKNNPTSEEIRWINSISKQKKTILTFFTRPYSLSSAIDYTTLDGVIMAYQNNNFTQKIASEIIFGSTGSKGKLSVSINDNFPVNTGFDTKEIKRLGFDSPENVGMDGSKLAQIDSIINGAIKDNMTPGAQIVVARRGKVIYQKSFGNHTYKDNNPVKDDDLYDVASLTKVLSTLPNLMQLYDKGEVTLSARLGDMLPAFKGSNKEDATLLDMLTHQARFQPWEPFYVKTLDATKHPDTKYYRKTPSKEFPFKVAENLYIRKDFNDTIISTIAKSKLLSSKQYKYSDFSFILLKEYLELKTQKKLDVLANENFYSLMGMNHTTYKPLEKFSLGQIIPTEEDKYYRYQTVQGNVHDMAAAMQGGVSGHAGLFSNALDVAKMMQMYLQNGVYGNNRFFSEKTMNAFNTCYYCDEDNRRGVGFDKPQLGNAGPTCGCVSMTSFGHTGFTGTMAWADPEKEIVYVFLSNRTYPDSNAANRLSRANIRENIQKIIYESIRD